MSETRHECPRVGTRTADCLLCGVTHALAVVLAGMIACMTTYFHGCSDTSTPPAPLDAGRFLHDAAHDGDVGPIGTAPTLAPCTATSLCADAPGVACLTDVAGGACTRRCTSDADCGAHGICEQHICLWSCTTGSGGCLAHAGACVSSRGPASYCAPICYPVGREPRGYPTCGAGLVCDPYTSTCVSSLSSGAENGAACRDSTECRGDECVLEIEYPSGAPTGFIDGMCVSLGVIPGPSDYVTGAPLPQGSCPDGSAVVPGLAATNHGDLNTCFRTCVSDGQCRTGYVCTHSEVGTTFTNGLCLPIDCSSRACPTGFTCSAMVSGWLGHLVCQRTP